MTAPAIPQSPYTPSDDDVRTAGESTRLLAAILGRGESARLRLIDGDQEITLPVHALHLLHDILNQMAEGNAVALVPYEAELTTQQAADFLNVSRPYLVGLLERGAIPFRKVGTRRRVLFRDLAAYRDQTQADMRQAADELTALSQELGLY